MVSVGLVTFVSHFVGLPSTSYGLPLTMSWKNFSSPATPRSFAGLPGQRLTTVGCWAATGMANIAEKTRTAVICFIFSTPYRDVDANDTVCRASLLVRRPTEEFGVQLG